VCNEDDPYGAGEVPTTSVGSTNGTRVIADRIRLPGKSNRAKTQAVGRPTMTVSTVDSTAWRRVKPATRANVASESTSPRTETSIVPFGVNPRTTIEMSG
jgi:hypothetical protein